MSSMDFANEEPVSMVYVFRHDKAPIMTLIDGSGPVEVHISDPTIKTRKDLYVEAYRDSIVEALVSAINSEKNLKTRQSTLYTGLWDKPVSKAGLFSYIFRSMQCGTMSMSKKIFYKLKDPSTSDTLCTIVKCIYMEILTHFYGKVEAGVFRDYLSSTSSNELEPDFVNENARKGTIKFINWLWNEGTRPVTKRSKGIMYTKEPYTIFDAVATYNTRSGNSQPRETIKSPKTMAEEFTFPIPACCNCAIQSIAETSVPRMGARTEGQEREAINTPQKLKKIWEIKAEY